MYKLELTEDAKRRHLDRYFDAIHDAIEHLSKGGALRYGRSVFKLAETSNCVRGLFRLMLSYNATRNDTILVSLPERHWQLIKDIERYVIAHKWTLETSPFKEFMHLMTWMFNYDRFKGGAGLVFDAAKGVIKGKGGCNWAPMDYIKFLNVRYCPYCNAESVYAIKKSKLTARSALDHYFPQSMYPYLAISLCNLVPSCTRCNTDIKGSRELDYNLHLHPFAESFHDGAVFEYLPLRATVGFRPESVKCEDDFDLDIKARAELRNTSQGKKALALGKFFNVDTVYNLLFKPEALKAIYRCRLMGSRYFEMLRAFLKDNLSEAQIRLLFADEVPDSSEINKTRLSKLVIDTQEWLDGCRD